MNQQTDLLPVQLGEKFRLARMAKNLSRKDVAQSLKLTTKILDWMESDQWQNLSQVYCQGYAKNYARLLDIDNPETRDQIQAISAPPPSLQPVFEPNIRPTNMDRNLRVVTYAAASIFLVGPLIWVFTDKMAKLSQNEPLMPQAEVTLDASGSQLPADSAGRPDHIQANVVPLAMLKSEHQPMGEADQPAIVEPEPDFDSPTQQSVTSALPAELIASSEPINAVNSLVLELNADSWVHITDANGKRLEYNLLLGGSRHDYQGAAPFQVLIGRASAVELQLDGEQIDLTEFASDNVASITIEPGKISRG